MEADAGLSGLGRYIVARPAASGCCRHACASRTSCADTPRRSTSSSSRRSSWWGCPARARRTWSTCWPPTPGSARCRGGRSIEPTPVLGDGPGRDGLDPRYLRVPRRPTRLTTRRSPRSTALMHDRPPWSIEEDCELVDLDLCSYTLEWHARVPSWRDHYLGLDQRVHYAVPAPGAPGAQLPAGTEPMGAEDAAASRAARTAAGHVPGRHHRLHAARSRSPCCSRRSRCWPTATACAGSQVEADELAAYWIDRIERLLRAAVRDAHLIPAGQRVDVEFGEFMADDLAMATSILDVGRPRAHRPAPHGARRPTWPATRAARRAGSVYDLRGDFGLDPDDALRAVRVLLRGLPPDHQGGPLTWPASTGSGPAPTPSRRDRRRAGRRPRRRHLDVAGTLEQLPARHRRRSHRASTPAWASRARCTVGPTTPSRPAPTRADRAHPGPLRPCRRRRRRSATTAPSVIAQANFGVVAGRQRTSRGVPVAQRRVRLDRRHRRGHGARRVAGRRRRPPRPARNRPPPSTTASSSTIGGRQLVLLSTPGGETTDSLVIWLPETRTAFTGNLFGPLFGHVPEPGHHARRPLPRRPGLRSIRSTWSSTLAPGPADHRPLRPHRRRRPHRRGAHRHARRHAVGARPHRRRA